MAADNYEWADMKTLICNIMPFVLLTAQGRPALQSFQWHLSKEILGFWSPHPLWKVTNVLCFPTVTNNEKHLFFCFSQTLKRRRAAKFQLRIQQEVTLGGLGLFQDREMKQHLGLKLEKLGKQTRKGVWGNSGSLRKWRALQESPRAGAEIPNPCFGNLLQKEPWNAFFWVYF